MFNVCEMLFVYKYFFAVNCNDNLVVTKLIIFAKGLCNDVQKIRVQNLGDDVSNCT